MQSTTKYKFAVAVLVIILFIIGQKLKESQNQNEFLNNRLDDYAYALQEANDNIEQANSNIEEAQSNAWSSYEDMGDALDNLETVDTVYEP